MEIILIDRDFSLNHRISKNIFIDSKSDLNQIFH